MTVRIAMWSGPRNISTAMLRAFENRSDTFVSDEPLYAHYLRETGAPHPGADEIVSRCETDPARVIEGLLGPVPGGKEVYYQKHMAHHLLPGMERDWVHRLTNCFLIRDPREMLLSLAKVTPGPELEDTALPQQVELFEEARRRTGTIPPVLDAKDVLDDPAGLLARLCERVALDFQPGVMLSWPPGRRGTDGIWAKHWYASVERSSGFEPWSPRTAELDDKLKGVYERCCEPYAFLYEHRLRA